MPQFCEDDFECNDGKANFPLQCIDIFVGKVCMDPPDFEPVQTRLDPNYERLLVPIEDPRDPRRGGPSPGGERSMPPPSW
jgi:hypothetical protein